MSESSRHERVAWFNWMIFFGGGGGFSPSPHARCYELQECVREKQHILHDHNQNTSRWTGTERRTLTTSLLPNRGHLTAYTTDHGPSRRPQTAHNQHCNSNHNYCSNTIHNSNLSRVARLALFMSSDLQPRSSILSYFFPPTGLEFRLIIWIIGIN